MKTSSVSEKFGGLKMRAARVPPSQEVDLYLRRARLAAAEERFDVARVFCEKARAIDPENLEVLFFLARVLDVGFRDADAAIALYQRIIATTGQIRIDRHFLRSCLRARHRRHPAKLKLRRRIAPTQAIRSGGSCRGTRLRFSARCEPEDFADME